MLPFLLSYWKELGLAAGLACAILLVKAELKISDLNGQLKTASVASAKQSQHNDLSGTANADTEITFNPVPCPPAAVDGKGQCPPCVCPGMTVKASASSKLAASSQQDQAIVRPAGSAQADTRLSIGLGAGVYGILNGVPYAEVSLPVFGFQAEARYYYPPQVWETPLKEPAASVGVRKDF